MRYCQIGGRPLRFKKLHQRAAGGGNWLAEQSDIVTLVEGNAPAVVQITTSATPCGECVQRERQMDRP